MKKYLILSWLVLMPLIVHGAQDATLINGLYFDLFDWYATGTCRLTGDYYSGDPSRSAYSGSIVIPSTVFHNGKTYTVTRIGANAFYHSSVTSVYIPNSVTTMDDDAFTGCSTLTTVLADMQNPPTFVNNRYLEASCVLIVPIEKKSVYTSKGWTTEKFTAGVYENALIKVDDKTMEYGDPKPTLTFSYASLEVFKNNPYLYSPCSSTAPVGEYYIEVNNKADVLESGYVTFIDGKMTITKAPLTITAKSYTITQGDPIPTFEVTYSGFRNGQTSSVLSKKPTITCSATSSSGPGTYDIIVSGAEATNYEMTYVKGTLTITGNQTISLSTLPTLTYGDAAYTLPSQTDQGQLLTWSISNNSVANVSGNTLTINSAGTATVTATAQSNSQYNAFSKEYTLTVNKAPLTITAQSYTITQGDEMPTFEVTYEGFKNGETERVLTTQPIFSCATTATNALGTYDIEVNGATADNYEITYSKGTLTIKGNQTIDDFSVMLTKTYGDDVYFLPQRTEQWEQLIWSSDNPSVAVITSDRAGDPSFNKYWVNITGAGSATLKATAKGNDKYHAFSEEYTLTVNKAPLTIIAQSYTITQGDGMPTFEVTYEGFKNGETESVLTKQPTFTCGATSTSESGEYEIIPADAETQNYEMTYVSGTLTIQPLFKEYCATPTIIYVNGKLVFDCATEGAICKSSITCDDIAEHNDSEIDLTVTYNISVYASAEGYNDSEVATATLCWIDTKPIQGIATGLVNIPATPILIKGNGGEISVSGLANGVQVSFYTVSGTLLGTTTSVDGKATINTSLTPGSIVIVKVGTKAIKYVVR